jgi:hypothetical protein
VPQAETLKQTSLDNNIVVSMTPLDFCAGGILMDGKELAELVPQIVLEKLEDASPPAPISMLEDSHEASGWSFRTGPALTAATVSYEKNELRITVGLAMNVPYTDEVNRQVNDLNATELIFGRAFLVGNDESGLGAVLMQEIILGDSLSWEFPSSIQNLLLILGTLSGQAARLSPLLSSRFGARPLKDDESLFLLLHS